MAAVTMATLAVSRRKQLPCGELRAEQADAIPGTRGYVGGTTDPTDLTHLGAREYDPSPADAVDGVRRGSGGEGLKETTLPEVARGVLVTGRPHHAGTTVVSGFGDALHRNVCCLPGSSPAGSKIMIVGGYPPVSPPTRDQTLIPDRPVPSPRRRRRHATGAE
ncbi:hypothetical protein [Streptomyces sp. NPDC048641]|uniref:hypothetical protein n=1 Tax=Streptomyces sp. NPDC048641 TaxID=3154825 RepID=UPI003438CE0E